MNEWIRIQIFYKTLTLTQTLNLAGWIDVWVDFNLRHIWTREIQWSKGWLCAHRFVILVALHNFYNQSHEPFQTFHWRKSVNQFVFNVKLDEWMGEISHFL